MSEFKETPPISFDELARREELVALEHNGPQNRKARRAAMARARKSKAE